MTRRFVVLALVVDTGFATALSGQGGGRGGRGGGAARKRVLAWADTRNGQAQHESVSHALATIEKLCDECIWMHKGEMRMWDEPTAVVEAYTDFLGVRDEDETERDPVTMEDV